MICVVWWRVDETAETETGSRLCNLCHLLILTLCVCSYSLSSVGVLCWMEAWGVTRLLCSPSLGADGGWRGSGAWCLLLDPDPSLCHESSLLHRAFLLGFASPRLLFVVILYQFSPRRLRGRWRCLWLLSAALLCFSCHSTIFYPPLSLSCLFFWWRLTRWTLVLHFTSVFFLVDYHLFIIIYLESFSLASVWPCIVSTFHLAMFRAKQPQSYAFQNIVVWINKYKIIISVRLHIVYCTRDTNSTLLGKSPVFVPFIYLTLPPWEVTPLPEHLL